MPRDCQFVPPYATFIVFNAAALCSAAALLGGDAAEERVKRLVDDVCLASPLTRRLNRELDMLEDLLALRHVGDFDRIEAERFAMIDPSSPVVEEICLLLDGLRDARNETTQFAA
ncbi:MAG: hypothetical protein FJX25_19180 [Alphaproteobacteria bacterium]|nr:hypothetical protein [Alphaproteobacteria bacterium]